MKRSLFMFSHDFPLNKGDTAFISSEFVSICNTFDDVDLLCLSKKSDSIISVPHNCSIHFLNPGNKVKRFTGIVLSRFFWQNLSLLHEEVQDLKASNIDNLHNCFTAFRFYLRAINICNRIKQISSKYDDFNIIYSFWSDAEVLASVIVWPNKPICARIHGYDLYEERAINSYQPFKKVVDRRLSQMFFISKQGKEYYLGKYFTGGLCEYSVSYLGTKGYKTAPNYVEVLDTIELLSISAVIPVKRVEMIVDALCLVDPQIRVHWTHIGSGEDFTNIQAMAEKKLKGNISYSLLGNLKHEDVIAYLNEKDFHVLINTSSSEGLPVSMMEALSYSIPIIGTDVGGVSEIVDKTDGILLPRNSTEKDYAHAIETIATMEQVKYKEMRRYAFEKWKYYFNDSKNNRMFANKLLSLVNNNVSD